MYDKGKGGSLLEVITRVTLCPAVCPAVESRKRSSRSVPVPARFQDEAKVAESPKPSTLKHVNLKS